MDGFSAGGWHVRCLTRCARPSQPSWVLRVAPVVVWLQGGGDRQGPREGLARLRFCDGVVVECSSLSALCLAPRGCGDRRAARFKKRDVLPNKQSQFSRAAAPDWDRHVLCPLRSAPCRKTNGTIESERAGPNLASRPRPSECYGTCTLEF